MPELPEVETTRRGIEPHILHRTITDVIVRQSSLRWPVPKQLGLKVRGQQIRHVNRRGKYLLICIDSGTIIIHLGMSGSLRICPVSTPPEKHDHIDFIIGDEQALRLRDPRRFGAVLLTAKDPARHKLLAPLGPEPMLDGFNGQYLFEHTRGRSASIKSVIMNSHIVVGVGNIYACESLYKAGINPRRKSGSLSLLRCEKLAVAIKQVLSASIQQGGTTLRDFVREDGQPGYFALKLNVYGKAGEPCPQCSKPIRQITQQQRSTFYCTQCQR
jgi:formamidopyrimidine-DNA glycosylase